MSKLIRNLITNSLPQSLGIPYRHSDPAYSVETAETHACIRSR